MVTEQKVFTLIVTFKWKDLNIIVQISTVKTNFNDKISAGIISVGSTEFLHLKLYTQEEWPFSRQMPAKG